MNDLNKLVEKNILIISFNEKNKNYDDNDIRTIITKINNIDPLCLIICTQESAQKTFTTGKHIQFMIQQKLIGDYQLLNSCDTSNIQKIKFKPTPRTRVYIKSNEKINKKDNIKKITIDNQEEKIEILCENNSIKKNNSYIIKTQIHINYNNSTKISKINIFNLDFDINYQNSDTFTKLFNNSDFHTFYCFKNRNIICPQVGTYLSYIEIIKDEITTECYLVNFKLNNILKLNKFDLNNQLNLINSIDKNNIDKCKLLIDKGIKLNVQIENHFHGYTPLMIAISNNNIEICKLLIEKGANVDMQDKRGYTPLMIGITKNNIEICKLLIEKGANVDIQDKSGFTALISTVIQNNIEIFKLLIEKGANVDIQDKSGFTTLMFAIKNNYIEICKLLIKNGAQLNLQDNKGNTALHITVNNNNIEICKLLIENDVDINLQNNDGYTALMIAKNKGFNNIIKLLILIDKFIKNTINKFKIEKTIDTDYILKFFYDLYDEYNSFNRNYSINYINSNSNKNKKYYVNRGKELNNLISKSNIDKYLKKQIIIRYKNEIAQNYGGVSREFFNSLETQINLKAKTEKEINLKKNQLITKKNQLIKQPKSNRIKNEIKELELEITNLNEIIESENEKNYSIKSIINILAISKLNKNPIFYINNKIKKIILINIKNLFNKTIEKNFIYNILNYISLESPNSNDNLYILQNNIFINHTKFERLFDTLYEKKNNSLKSENEIKNEINYLNLKKKNKLSEDEKKKLNEIEKKKFNENIEKNIKKIENINKFKNNYINILLDDNSLKYLNKTKNSNEIENIKSNNLLIEENSDNIMEHLNMIINDSNIYINIYDFFISHFVQKMITIDSFLANLIIDCNNEINDPNLKDKIIEIFKNFEEKELYKFNQLISGNTYKLSNKYEIKIGYSVHLFYHTCFNSLDIPYIDNMFSNKIEFTQFLLGGKNTKFTGA
jgi:ankyrin repeat protein